MAAKQIVLVAAWISSTVFLYDRFLPSLARQKFVLLVKSILSKEWTFSNNTSTNCCKFHKYVQSQLLSSFWSHKMQLSSRQPNIHFRIIFKIEEKKSQLSKEKISLTNNTLKSAQINSNFSKISESYFIASTLQTVIL